VGDVYLKMLPDLFIREFEVTQRLMEWHITSLPQWLAADANRKLILMRDMGGCDLSEGVEVDLWETMVRRLAQFQIASIPLVNAESPSPFYDWRLPVIVERIDTLADEASVLLHGSPYQLTELEMSALRERLPQWKDRCVEINDFGLPNAVDHGDLRPGNIRLVADTLIFYDWAWSSIAHPFLSPVSLLHILRRSLLDAPGGWESLRDTYLEAWKEYATMDRLREVFHLVDKLLPLYGVIAAAAWLQAIWEALHRRSPQRASAAAWTLERRQYYFAKGLRRLL
jgi:hypothetical protein